jgi:hypothetical protein
MKIMVTRGCEKHSDFATAESNIGIAYYNLGKFGSVFFIDFFFPFSLLNKIDTKALQSLRSSLSLRKNLFSSNNVDLAINYVYVSFYYYFFFFFFIIIYST